MKQFLRSLGKQRQTGITFGLISLFLILTPGTDGKYALAVAPVDFSLQPAVIELESVAPVPVLKEGVTLPEISARGLLITDLGSGTELAEKAADAQLLPASTTKIMTALIALENYDPGMIVEIVNEDRSVGMTANLVAGETITVKNLLAAMLINSGNDAALALAQAYPGGYLKFIQAMNEKTKLLGLNNSNFANVSGVDSVNHYTSARDLSVISKEALKYDLFAETVNIKSITIRSEDDAITHVLNSTNQLLGVVPGVRGVKTGWTPSAGECLVTLIKRDGHEILIVMLGSRDRFGETRQLINWVFDNHTFEDLETLLPEMTAEGIIELP